MEEKKIIMTKKFKENEIELFSNDFNNFKNQLAKSLGKSPDFLNNKVLLYKDEEGDSQEITNEEQYKIFFDNIKMLNNLEIQVVEGNPFSQINNKKNINNINNPNDNDNEINNEGLIDNNKNIHAPLNQSNNNNKKKNDFYMQIKCEICGVFSYWKIIYYCQICNTVLCPKCESDKYNKNHCHYYYKIQNKVQYNLVDPIIKRNNIIYNWGNNILDQVDKNFLNSFYNVVEELNRRNEEKKEDISIKIQKFKDILPKANSMSDNEVLSPLIQLNILQYNNNYH